MRIAVITSNFGNFDTIKEIPEQTIKYDRFYFNEDNSPYPAHTINDRLKAKIYKLIPHIILPNYDLYVWVDANISVKSNLFLEHVVRPFNDRDILKTFKYPDIDFVISPHPERDNIYDEATFIINNIHRGSKYLSARYTAESIEKEIEHIGKGLKGLYYCGVFARRNDPVINQMCENWYLDNVLWTNFDQINFISNVYKYHIKIHSINFGNFYNNAFYKLASHNKVA